MLGFFVFSYEVVVVAVLGSLLVIFASRILARD